MKHTAPLWLAVVSLLFAMPVPAAARTRPRYGGTLHMDTRSDPLKAPDGAARRLLFDTLTQVNDNGEVVPALAVTWESQSANHRWQFHLRSGVHFHDGSPLTADVVEQSLSAACARCGWRVRAVGDSVVITSESPLPGLPAELARTMYAITRQAADGTPNGTGPFRFVANSNGIAFLAANDDSWQGRPFLNEIQIYGNRTIREQWLDLKVGKADLVDVPPELLLDAQQERIPLVITARPTDLLTLTMSDQLITDAHLRQSIALALDRTSLFNVIFRKQGEVTASLLPNVLSGYSFLLDTAMDTNRSRALRGGQSLPLRLGVDASNPTLQLVAERLALNLRDAGWNVHVVSQATSTNPELSLRLLHVEAASASSVLRETLEDFGAVLEDDAADPASLYRAESAFLQSHTVVPLLYLPRAYGVSTRVHNLVLSPSGAPELANVSVEDAR
jgi:peptide/nickel transport system substrate-binding protein